MKNNSLDLIIAGGRPTNATTVLFAHRWGLNTLLVDKTKFPQDNLVNPLFYWKLLFT